MNKPTKARGTIAIACQNVSVDFGGRLTLHELTNQVLSLRFPARSTRLYAVFGIVPEAAGLLIAIRVEVVSSSGTVVAGMEFPDIIFRADRPVHHTVAALSGVAWPEPGRYRVQLTSRGTIVAAMPIDAVLVRLDPPAAA